VARTVRARLIEAGIELRAVRDDDGPA